MFADISHERQQSLLRQRNLFALTSAGLAVALAVTTSLAATRDREVVLLPTLPKQLTVSSAGVEADYLELVDWSGRVVRSDRRGAIDERAPPILQRLNIDRDVWRQAMQIRGNVFGRALGKLDHLRLHARAIGQSRIQGTAYAERLFG